MVLWKQGIFKLNCVTIWLITSTKMCLSWSLIHSVPPELQNTGRNGDFCPQNVMWLLSPKQNVIYLFRQLFTGRVIKVYQRYSDLFKACRGYYMNSAIFAVVNWIRSRDPMTWICFHCCCASEPAFCEEWDSHHSRTLNLSLRYIKNMKT